MWAHASDVIACVSVELSPSQMRELGLALIRASELPNECFPIHEGYANHSGSLYIGQRLAGDKMGALALYVGYDKATSEHAIEFSIDDLEVCDESLYLNDETEGGLS